MTGTEALSRLEEIGARIVLLPDDALDVTGPAGPETEALVDELAAHKPEAVAVLRERRGPRRLLPFDEERARRLEERRGRTLAALAERYCATCGFSLWRVTPRGDASCYACDLIREGRPLRCARCGLEEWRRDEHGRRACATCSEGDARVAALPEIVSLSETSGEFSEEGGTV